MCPNRGIKTKIYKETGVSTHWEKILTILPSKVTWKSALVKTKAVQNDISVSNARGQQRKV